MKNAIAALALVLVLFVTPAFAEPAAAPAKPSKESLLAAWEKVQRDDPYTVTFAKSEKKDVYNFETTIFPYKGQIKVLNLLIEKKPAFYYGEFRSYNEELPEGDYIGLVEIELADLGKEFVEKHRYSYSTWDQRNGFYYNAETNKWYTEAQWSAHKAALKAREVPASASSGGSCSDRSAWMSSIIRWAPLAGFLALWIPLLYWLGLKQQKKAKKIQDEYLDECRAINKGIEERSIESISLQKQMLEVLKNKN